MTTEDNNTTELNSEKTTYTAEEVEALKKEMEANYERWIQKKFKDQKVYDTVLDEIWKVAEDKTRLIELSDSSPEVAKIILDKYYDWMDIDAFKKSINYTDDYTDPETIKKLVSKEAQLRADERYIDEKKKDFIEKLKMTPEEIKDFENAFAERRELKSFSIENLNKYLEKSYQDISSNLDNLKELKNKEILGKNTALGSGKNWNDVKWKDTHMEEAEEFLKKFWI